MGQPVRDLDPAREAARLEKISTELEVIIRNLNSSEQLVHAHTRYVCNKRNPPAGQIEDYQKHRQRSGDRPIAAEPPASVVP